MDKNTERYRMLSDEIHTKIKQEVSRIGKKKISLISEEDKEDTDTLFSLPFFVKVSKHGFYSEYAMHRPSVRSLKIRLCHTIRVDEENKIFLDGTEKGESSDEGSISLDDCSELYSLCQIADILSEM